MPAQVAGLVQYITVGKEYWMQTFLLLILVFILFAKLNSQSLLYCLLVNLLQSKHKKLGPISTLPMQSTAVGKQEQSRHLIAIYCILIRCLGLLRILCLLDTATISC